jgi:hypothetical protein
MGTSAFKTAYQIPEIGQMFIKAGGTLFKILEAIQKIW